MLFIIGRWEGEGGRSQDGGGAMGGNVGGWVCVWVALGTIGIKGGRKRLGDWDP